MRWSGQPSESVNESSQQPAVGQTDHWVIKKLGILENNLGSLPDPFVLFIFSCVLLFQWLVFFRQTTELTMHVPLFGKDVNRFRENPAIVGFSLCFSQQIFRAFAKLVTTKRPPSDFFIIVRIMSPKG